MAKNNNFGIVLLAAGSSSRLGHNKLMLTFEGRTMIEMAILSACKSVVNQIVVVTGAYPEIIAPVLEKHNVTSVFNENWERGIGSSIKCGIDYLVKKNPELKGVIISVCDQPYLNFAIFDELIEEQEKTGRPIIASDYGGTLGVPVLYNRALFDDLLKIPDESGAKKYMIDPSNNENLGSAPFPKGNIDIDTVEDIKKLTRT